MSAFYAFYLELGSYTLSNTVNCKGSIIELTGGRFEIRSDSTGGLVANGVDGVVVTGGTLTMEQKVLIRAEGENRAAIRMQGGNLNSPMVVYSPETVLTPLWQRVARA